MGHIIYQTFTNDDYILFNSEYNERCIGKDTHLCPDFAKKGMNSTYSIRKDWQPNVIGAYNRNTSVGCVLVDKEKVNNCNKMVNIKRVVESNNEENNSVDLK
jgi:hypothetical protein